MAERFPDRREVVRCWETIERFNPQNVPEAGKRRVVDLQRVTALPWDPEEEKRRGRPRRKQTVWHHSVYIGAYQVEQVDELLDTVFGVDDGQRRRHRPTWSALAAFDVTAAGVPVVSSIVVSACAWAAGRLHHPGPKDPQWLRGFEDDAERLRSMVQRHLRSAQIAEHADHDKTPRLAYTTLDAIRDDLAEGLGVAGVLACRAIRVKTMRISRSRLNRSDAHDFLNSFIANDLRKVADRLGAGEYGRALADYLRPDEQIDRAARIDIRKKLSTVRQLSAPAHVPLGRWPSSPDQPLALGQQLAVNAAWARLANSAGLFAVNGPPGTGKTTMLRDIVAAVVVERARAVAALTDPKDAFDRGRWIPALQGFEIVVASSNNAAVQNVIDELPTTGAVDPRWPHDVPELVEVAEALLRPEPEDDNDEADQHDDGTEPVMAQPEPVAAWALIAARLGRMQHRNTFVSRFWWGDRDGRADEDDSDEEWPRQPAMLNLLDQLRQPGRRRSWSESVARFNAALASAEAAAVERSSAHEAIEALAAAEWEANQRRTRTAAAEAELARLAAALASAEEAYARQQGDVAQAVRRLGEHGRPRWSVWRFGAAGRRRDRHDELGRTVSDTCAARDAAKSQVSLLHRQLAEHAKTVDGVLRSAQATLARVERLRATRAAAELLWGAAVPDAGWENEHDKERVRRRELTALWNDEQWSAVRTELVLAALELHRDYLAVAPRAFDQGLQDAIRIIRGDGASLAAHEAVTAWQTLFFVVPVVSTTFASFARLFTDLGTESLGWLLIDEAGQAAPQNAVGAIWRSRRAIVVGDPMQLEPVVTISTRAQEAIRGAHGVDRRWIPENTSVQQLADELTDIGTAVPTNRGEVWVGAPLRVHRRCEEPMFSIVNQIAYGGQMIDGVPPRPPISLPISRWIDVCGSTSEGNLIAEEHAVLRGLLSSLAADYQLDLSSVLLISPFRDVADEFAELPHLDRAAIEFGTTHRSQGRESDVVILVLGGTEGARWWAAEKPNLLNVAVSRARRRLYVIGDRASWRKRNWFKVLSSQLPLDDL